MKKPKVILILVILVSCAFSALLIVQNLNRKDSASPTSAATPHNQELVKQPEVHYGLPVRLKIPKINVDAPIDQMGVTPEGDMQEPSKPENTGWYKFGPHPGNKGSAVIAGHYGLDEASVFNKLHTLNTGDTVQVEDEKGAIATFVVNELKTYDKNATAPEVFSSSDEKTHLNLITCKGTWQNAEQTYSDRLVVFANSE